jgi:hypothetical protein
MPWLWEEIEQDWLAGGVVVDAPEVVVDAFNRVEARFGRAWIEASRQQEGSIGPVRGTLPTLNVIVLGQQLRALEGSSGCGALLRKLRDREPSANAELAAIWLASHDQTVELECEPEVEISRRLRKSDFRLRRDADPWSYVEVTQPNRSAAELSVRAAMTALASLIETTTGTYTAEVFFLRLPEPGELVAVRSMLEDAEARLKTGEISLPDDLGVIYLNASPPGLAVVDNHGYPTVPRLGDARVVAENGEPVRQISVRMPYFDLRGHQFLATEASQLPEDAPGLIMIQTSGAPGAIKEWLPVLEGELELDLYRQVSGVCLFQSGFYAGESWRVSTKLILNPGAVHRLPEWLETQLRKYETEPS